MTAPKIDYYDPKRPPIAFGYTRVSTEEQAKSGLGLEAQSHSCEDYYKFRLGTKGIPWGGTFTDPATSATIPMLDRKAGRALDLVVKQGDHVVFPKLDRAWRSIFDMETTMMRWRERGVIMHFASEGISLEEENYMSTFFVQLLCAFAQMERSLIRQRIKDGIAAKKRRTGGHVFTHAKIGFKLGRGKDSPHVPHLRERLIMAAVLHMKDVQGMTATAIALKMSRERVKFRDTRWSVQYTDHVINSARELELVPSEAYWLVHKPASKRHFEAAVKGKRKKKQRHEYDLPEGVIPINLENEVTNGDGESV